ncbi:MAG TPA: Ig-like domain-containing protein [Caulifigura sp.]|nr:Ig-like domain-containing protein [Caulifigura sp.]
MKRVSLFGRAVRGGEITGWLVVTVVVLALVALLSDAFFAWPVAMRMGIDIVAAAGLLAAGLLIAWKTFGSRSDARTVARLAEARLARHDSLFINAVEFRTGVDSGSATLRESVVRSADAAAAALTAAEVTPPAPAIRATLAGVAAILVFGIGLMIAPRLFATVIPRFLDPGGDHPPFTLLSFSASVKPEPLHRGKPAMVIAEISGPERVEEASLVSRPAGDLKAKWDRVPMFRQAESTFSTQLTRVDSDLEFHVDTPRGRSQWFELRASQTPLIEDAKATLTFPNYTGWKSRDQQIDDRGLRGLRGTACSLVIRSNVPLSGGQVRLFAAGDDSTASTIKLIPVPSDGGVATGAFVIDRNGRFELSVTSESGYESDVLSGPIVALPDRPPQVAITAPAETLIAVEGWKIPVEIQASDDVGIARVRLFRGVNGWGSTVVTLPHEFDSQGVTLSRSEFDLGALGARAGDIITYYASADEQASDRPQSTDSATHTIQVISEAEYRDFARQQYQMEELTEEFESFRKELDRLNEERQKAVEQLEQLLQKQAAGEALTDADREQMEQLEKQLEQFAKAAAELAQTLEERADEMQLYDLEQQYTEELKKFAKELNNQSEQAEHLSKLLKQQKESKSPKLADELQEAAEQFQKDAGPFDEESQEELDKLGGDLETLRKADELNEQVERLQAVTSEQRELANRMSELAGKTSLTPDEQARADRFAKEQEQLAQELESIQKSLREAAAAAEEKLPEMADSAKKLAEALDQLVIPQEQLSAAQQAREQQGDAAHGHAENAARKLESLMQAAGEVQNTPGLEKGLDGPLQLSKQQLKNSLSQMRRGRRPPGLGQRGQKGGQSGGEPNGQGQSGSSSGGQASDGKGRLRPGQSSKRGDSDAQVMGPRTQEAVESSDKTATMQADGKGKFVLPGVSGEQPSSESMTPNARRQEGLSGSNLKGVPVGYRDAAEAYLRRLSEEKRSK